MKSHSLDTIEKLLERVLTPAELFAEIPVNELLFSTHPDRNLGEKKRAEKLFNTINDWNDKKDQPTTTIQSPKRIYSLLKLVSVGDVADVYRAKSDNTHYLLKLSRIPDSHYLLDNERKALTALLTDAGDTTYGKYLPTLAESFPVQQHKIQHRANVFLYQTDYHSAVKIHEQHPTLGGRHLAWMYKRLLTGLGFIHQRGWCHGAILPEHCLYQTDNHGMMLVGWGQSIESKNRLTSISVKYKDWYPPEVFKKQLYTPESDIFMAAKLMIYLGGGNPVTDEIESTTPDPLKRFLKSCLLPGKTMRPGDAWALLDEFNKVLTKVYGKPRFIKLVMA